MNLSPTQAQEGGHRRRAWPTGREIAWTGLVLFAAVLVAGTWRNPNFWLTADQHGDQFMREKKFAAAAQAYTDSWQVGVAQYRNGNFVTAAKTFARVPGATGAYDQGNAWLLRGNYAAAVESYDRALGFQPGWKEAEENKALAIARQAALDAAGKDRDQEQLDDKGDDEMTPDKIVFDQKGDDQKGAPTEINGAKMSDEQWRATWLRRVQTTPGDFLRMKFAYQASHPAAAGPGTPGAKEEGK